MKKLTLATLVLSSVFAVSTFANQPATTEPAAPEANATQQQFPQQMGKHEGKRMQGKGMHEHRGKGNKRMEGHGKHGGGFINTDQAVNKVSDLNAMQDDQFLVLQGKIVKQVGKKNFIFRDASGEVEVEISHHAWAGQTITPNDEIKLYGDVDKSWNKTEVEIHRIEKVK